MAELIFGNYIPITLSASFLKQKLQFPNISDLQTYEGTFTEIAEHKDELIRLNPDYSQNLSRLIREACPEEFGEIYS